MKNKKSVGKRGDHLNKFILSVKRISILLGGFICASGIGVSHSQAGRKIASIRGVSPGESREVTANRPRPNARREIELLREASLNALGRVFLYYESPEQFRDLVLRAAPQNERRQIRPFLVKGMAKFEPRRVGDTLELRSGSDRFVVRWPKFPAPVLNINGVDWAVSYHQSLKFNVELLQRLLVTQKSHASRGRLRLFLPAAEASGLPVSPWKAGLIGAILAVGIQGGVEVGKDFVCSVMWGTNDLSLATCSSYIQKVAESKKYREALSAVKAEVSVKKTSDTPGKIVDEMTIWVPGAVKQCPTGKTQDVYIADIKQVTIKGGAIQRGDWQTARFELEPGTGKVKGGIIVPMGVDPMAPDAAEKARAVFEFGDQGLKTIQVENAQRKVMPTASALVPLSMEKDAQSLAPWEATERKKWVETLKQVNTLIAACIVEETKSKVEKLEGKAPPAGSAISFPTDSQGASAGSAVN